MFAALPAYAETQQPTGQPEQSQNLDGIRPVSPDEVVKTFDKAGDNLTRMGQGAAKNLLRVGPVAAGIVILLGAALLIFTKSLLNAGIAMVFGLIAMYFLVYHGDKIVGILKGIGQ
jgi:hypothetical protein